MAKILVTGGSGFIGTNLVEYFANQNHEIINFDIKPPKNKLFIKNWFRGDILNLEEIQNCFDSFSPEYVIHLAARTDLNEKKSLKGYEANILGVQNILQVTNNFSNIKRAIYASSRMVCKIDHVPKDFNDFCPPNLYGESKMIGEKMVVSQANHDFVVIRPTSIWGPFFEIPYKTFFDSIKNKTFFMPKNHNPKKSFGFVYNSVYQIDKLLFEEKKKLNKVYYLTDYPSIELQKWADLISNKFHGKDTKKIPFIIFKIVSKIGDFFQLCGWKNVPLTTFRLNNLITNMEYDTKDLEEICGKLPYTLNNGVDLTVDWMNNNNF